MPALQRVPGVPQDRPHAALPPLWLRRARAARVVGGVGIAITCDMRIAADDARFGIPAARLGLRDRGLLREGLAFDRCQVAIVTNIGDTFWKLAMFRMIMALIPLFFIMRILPTNA